MRLLLFLLACTAKNAPAEASESPEAPVAVEESVSDVRDGSALAPVEGLLAWLDGEAKGKTVQLPVVVTLHPAGMGVTGAHVGVVAGPAGPEDVRLKLDTGALGVRLTDQVQPFCDGAQCVVWLEGTWGALVGGPGPMGPGGPSMGPGGPGPSMGPSGPPGPPTPGTSLGGPPGPAPKEHPFSVRKVVGPVEAGTTHARIR